MQKKQVAVIDIGSSKIKAYVSERGVNDTFLIKSSFTYDYDGFADGVFLDADKVSAIIENAVERLKQSYRKNLSVIYVGVPGSFTKVVVKDSQISFPKKKKITDADVNSLFDGAFVIQSGNYKLINRSAVVYELDDHRKVANPVGLSSEILKGKLSFVLCENYFLSAVASVIEKSGEISAECVSSSLAESLYLIGEETRDRVAVLCDIGYITTTLSIVQGDGLLYQKSFDFGGGFITADISEKFELDFEKAEAVKRKVNICSLSAGGAYALIENDGEYYNSNEIKNSVIDSLDSLCENLEKAFDESGYILPDYVTLSITGGGISFIRGAKEHIAGRLAMNVEIIAPKVPLMDKPTESSALSLMNMALNQ
ncbi:MAG: pilus assembly protein PilM [Candidatus Borkfalkiaceae bacterium]|nr:pilus assembly protein PilM [Christensenellaceae bacterium]